MKLDRPRSFFDIMEVSRPFLKIMTFSSVGEEREEVDEGVTYSLLVGWSEMGKDYWIDHP